LGGGWVKNVKKRERFFLTPQCPRKTSGGGVKKKKGLGEQGKGGGPAGGFLAAQGPFRKTKKNPMAAP